MPLIADGSEQVNRVRVLMIHQGLCMEEKGMRMTAKAPTCLSICKREYGLKGPREKIRRGFEAIMREMGGYEEYLARRGFPESKTCGKCSGTITSPGPCPICDDKPFGGTGY